MHFGSWPSSESVFKQISSHNLMKWKQNMQKSEEIHEAIIAINIDPV